MAVKTCVVCGDDCAGRPRTKDARGRYYHVECYERRKAERAGAGSLGTPPPPPPLPSPPPPPLDADDVVLEAAPCPHCGAPMEGVICMGCGYNVQTGTQLTAKVETDRRPDRAARGRVWPLVVGLVSIGLGFGGTALHALGFAFGAGDGVPAPAGGEVPPVSAIIPFGLSVWLGIGGVGVLLRRDWGPRNLLRWAKVKIALAILATICLVPLITMADLEPIPVEGFGTVTKGMVAVLAALLIAWVVAWPVAVSVWFRRPAVESEVESWS